MRCIRIENGCKDTRKQFISNELFTVLKSFPSALVLLFLALPFGSGETNCYFETRKTRKKYIPQKTGT
jgi:hypothetical protein